MIEQEQQSKLLYHPFDELFTEVKGLYGFPFHNSDLSTKIVPLLDFVYGLNDFNDILYSCC